MIGQYRNLLVVALLALWAATASIVAAEQTAPDSSAEGKQGAAEQPEAEPKTFDLGEMVVTPARRQLQLTRSPAAVGVITQQDTERLPAQNVAEFLHTQVGLRTSQPQGQGIVTPQSMAMRGISGSGRTLLLVDGQPWNSGFTDYFYFSKIPMEAVKRIEVVRGPFSALYGSNAMAGVVHVITKDSWGKELQASGLARYGNFGRAETTETVGGYWDDKVSVFASHSHYETDNYYLNDDDADQLDDEGDPILDTRNRNHNHERFHTHMRAKLREDLNMDFSVGGFKSETDFGVGSNLGIDNEMDTDRYYLNANGTWDANERVEVFFGSDYVAEKHEYTGETLATIDWVSIYRGPFLPPIVYPDFDYEPSLNKSGFYRTRLHGGANIEIFDNNTLTLGGEYDWVYGYKRVLHRSTGEFLPVLNRPGEKKSEHEDNWSVYIQDDWRFFDEQVQLVLGMRYDDFEGYGDNWSPKGTLIWHYLDTGRVKLSGGKAFRAPTINHRLTPPWTMAPFLTYIGNPDLDAETLKSYEVSFENEFFDRKVDTRVTPFKARAKDFITTATLRDPLDPSGRSTLKQPQNIQRVKIKGVETEVGYRPIEPLRLFANHQYAKTEDRHTHEVLDNHPRNTMRWGATWYSRHFGDFMGLTAGLVGRYTSGQTYTTFRTGGTGHIEGHVLWDTRVGLDFWKRRLSVFADVFNLFDQKGHRTASDDFIAERNWLVGAQVRYEF